MSHTIKRSRDEEDYGVTSDDDNSNHDHSGNSNIFYSSLENGTKTTRKKPVVSKKVKTVPSTQSVADMNLDHMNVNINLNDKKNKNNYDNEDEVDISMETDIDVEGDEDFDNSYKETGQIIKIHVEKFMCHEKFTVSFGRHINFITGQNGSGKSAIVSAVQLCLGATAKTTGRGSNLAGFVKEGTDGPAIAQVTLLNEGDDAYKPDEYGKKIVIERKISKSGVSSYTTYKIESSGRYEVVSHEKREVDGILRYFNIYVDNPCCVLTQEEAKKFIQGEDREKYDFFLKASGLHRTKEELIITKQLITEATEKKEKYEQSLISKTEENRKLREELDLWINFDSEEHKVKILQAKVFWAKLFSIKHSLNKQKNLAKQYEDEMMELEFAEKQAHNELEAKGNFDIITQEIERIQSDLKVLKTELDQKNTLVNESSKDVNKIKTKISNLERGKKEQSARLVAVNREIDDLRSKALADADGIERQLLEEREELSNQVIEFQRQEADLRQQRNDIIVTKQRLSQVLNYSNQSLNNLLKEVEKLNHDKQALSSAKIENQKAVKFGSHIPDLLFRISQERFLGPVLGPIGLHISLLKNYEQYSFAIERALGSVIQSFIVTNVEDREKLQRVIEKINIKTPHRIIIQSATRRYTNVSTIPNGTNVLDVVSIEDDIVFNTLVDQIRPENTVIVNNEEDIKRHYLSRDHRGKFCLRDHIQRAVSLDGVLYSYKYGNQSAEEPDKQCKYLLSSDTTAVIESIEQQLQMKTNEIISIREQIEKEQNQLREFDTSLHNIDRNLRDITNHLRTAITNKNEIQARLNEVKEISNIDTTSLEIEDAELRKAIEAFGTEIGERKLELEAANIELNNRKQDKNSYERQKEELNNQLDQQEILINNFISDTTGAKNNLKRCQNALNKKKGELEELNNILLEMNKTFALSMEEATIKTRELVVDWNGEPLPLHPKDTVQSLERQVKAQSQDLKDRREELMERMKYKSIETLQADYDRSQTDLDKTKESFEKFCQHIEELTEDFQLRSKKWNRQRGTASKLVGQQFDKNLQGMGFAGNVQFMHKEATLELQVQTDNMNNKTRAHDVRQISGGERSYVALCFLLALGCVIESPFRIMDEYDVFLDNDARNYTLDRLQHHAMEAAQQSRQFFIITPHNLNNVKVNDNVRILVVPPPFNVSAHGLRQSTLTF